MSQDTRKDKRAKIVSLNVRYKSATVDEFIENHSHDVSKGGLFIKTPTPFPPGTLLKFEIRIAGDKAVIAGVGRVVWKREPTQSGAERPAGMGVKFIKIDENSRAVIDKLIGVKSDAGSAYESGGESGSIVPLAPGSNPSELPPGVSGLPPRPGAVPSAPPVPRKATMLGIGQQSAGASSPPATISAGPPASAPGSPPPMKATNPMFPATNSEADMPPPKERTVMKQAAELLEEALKEAGGSMDDIGQNPLFTPEAKAAPSKPSNPGADSKPAPSKPAASPLPPAAVPDSPATLIGLQATPDPDSEKVEKAKPSKPTDDVAGTPETTRESPNAKSSPPAAPAVTKPVKSDAPKKADWPAARAVATPEKKSNTMMWLVLAVAVGGGGVYAYQTGMIGGDGPAPQATTPPVASTPPKAVPAVTTPSVTTPTTTDTPAGSAAVPSGSADVKPSASADAATTAADAGKTAPVGSTVGATTATTTTTTTAVPTKTAPPPVTATPPPPVTARPTPTPRPPPVTPPPPTTDTPTATVAPPPKPPKPPPKPVDDNPY